MRSADQSAATTMKQHTITSLPPSPEAERRARMIKYTIAMSIRVLCIFMMLFAQGWWLVVCAAGAIFLPYVAVVLANVGGGEQGAPERPGGLVVAPRADAPPAPRPVDDADRPAAAPADADPAGPDRTDESTPEPPRTGDAGDEGER